MPISLEESGVPEPIKEAGALEITVSSRRHDIDWLRVILFGLLIWFHYAVFSLDQLKNRSGMDLPVFFAITVMHQWRLAALFVISGMGTAFAFRRRTWKTYVKEREFQDAPPSP